MCIYTNTLKEENTQLPSCTHTYILKVSLHLCRCCWRTGQPLDHWTTILDSAIAGILKNKGRAAEAWLDWLRQGNKRLDNNRLKSKLFQNIYFERELN